jgi:hypothetical protein
MTYKFNIYNQLIDLRDTGNISGADLDLLMTLDNDKEILLYKDYKKRKNHENKTTKYRNFIKKHIGRFINSRRSREK